MIGYELDRLEQGRRLAVDTTWPLIHVSRLKPAWAFASLDRTLRWPILHDGAFDSDLHQSPERPS